MDGASQPRVAYFPMMADIAMLDALRTALTGHCYRLSSEGNRKPWALNVLELSGDRIVGINSFLDTETLFPRFDLPSTFLA